MRCSRTAGLEAFSKMDNKSLPPRKAPGAFDQFLAGKRSTFGETGTSGQKDQARLMDGDV